MVNRCDHTVPDELPPRPGGRSVPEPSHSEWKAIWSGIGDAVSRWSPGDSDAGDDDSRETPDDEARER